MSTASRIALVSLSALAGAAAMSAFTLPLGTAIANQPAMQNAINHLQNARVALNNATADKGGHKVKALGLIDQAIAEVRAGIAFDAKR